MSWIDALMTHDERLNDGSLFAKNGDTCIYTVKALQVADGQENIAAGSLYDRFGFEPASGCFNEPNQHLRVVWDIETRLRALINCPRRCSPEVTPAQLLPNRLVKQLPGPAPATPSAAMSAHGDDGAYQRFDELMKLPAKQLKQHLHECGASHAGCLEKHDLVERLLQVPLARMSVPND